MKTIGVDLDDVLLNFNDSWLDFHNQNYGTAYKRESVTTFSVEEAWGITVEELYNRFHFFYNSDHHKNSLPVTGAVEAIEQLAQDNHLVIVTSSPQSMEDKIQSWLDKHFAGKFKGVHFTKKDFLGQKRSKGEMCIELGIDAFIDDHPDNAAHISACGIPVYLLDTPWNQGETGPLVKRVYSWKEIVDDLNK